MRDYFPGCDDTPTLVLTDVQLLTRPSEHAPTLAEAVARICTAQGDPQ